MPGHNDVVPVPRNNSDGSVLQIYLRHDNVPRSRKPQIHGIFPFFMDDTLINRPIKMNGDGLEVRELKRRLINAFLSEPETTTNRHHRTLRPMPFNSMKTGNVPTAQVLEPNSKRFRVFNGTLRHYQGSPTRKLL